MRSLISAALLALALARPVCADPDATALRTVISDQIAAFLADDIATAFSYASPGIRRLFGTPERFGAMVRNDYPMVWRPDRVRFLELEGTGDAWRQIVEITDREGQPFLLDYGMVRTPDGWRIDGVRFLPAPPAVS